MAFCLLAGLLAMQSVAAPARDSPRMKRILVFGDSLSEGYLLRSSETWPMVLVEKLRDAGLRFEVVNASQSGGTTTGGLARLSAQLKRPVDIFIVQLGINDAFRGVPVGEIEANLQKMIDRVREKNPSVQVVIAGMQLPDNGSEGYIRDFGQMYADLATKNHAALVPYLLEGVGGNPALNLGDRIHPNAAGHKILAQNVWAVLEPIARDVAQGRTANAGR
ncbi:MAG TPA: arylesterase [Chthoniobacterales bacterium]|nr:arylesterase [Chthoniobacterales bacterium]